MARELSSFGCIYKHICTKRGQRGVWVIITSWGLLTGHRHIHDDCALVSFLPCPPCRCPSSSSLVSGTLRTLTWHQQLAGAVDQIVHNWLEGVEGQRFQFVCLDIDGQEGGRAAEQSVVDLLQQIIPQIQGFQRIQAIESTFRNSLQKLGLTGSKVIKISF